MPFHSHRLPNGLEIIGETNPAALSSAVGFFVRTGARDETPDESGVSHFLEHMVFKGTPRRTALDVNLDFDRIGAKYNAYTSEEFTVYHAAVLPEYLPRAVDILSDILRPSLRAEDFETEKQVILEEIDMYDDQPPSAAGDHARRLYYGPHPLGNSILGTPASVGGLTPDRMHAYFARRYGAANVLVSAAGNLDWDAFVALMTESCAAWGTGEPGRAHRTPWAGDGSTHVLSRAKVQQEYVMTFSGGPPADSPLRYAADVLSLALGDAYGSRLYWALVDPGKTESADAGYYEYDGNGTVGVSFTSEPDDAAENLGVVRGLLSELQADGITADELRQAKSKIASRVVRGSERPMGRMQAIAAAWVYHREYRDVDAELARYDAVSLADVRAVLDQYPVDAPTTVAFGPLTAFEGVTGTVV